MDYVLSLPRFINNPTNKAPLPSPVSVTGIRFPADYSPPHLITLTTTTDSVADNVDACWGHIPDFRPFWKPRRAWLWRDFETFRIAKCHTKCRQCGTNTHHLDKEEEGVQAGSRQCDDDDDDRDKDEENKNNCCVGLYVLCYSFDQGSLPVHSNFPEGVFGRPRKLAGDAFVFRLQGNEIGEELGDDSWAVWRDVSVEMLSLGIMAMNKRMV